MRNISWDMALTSDKCYSQRRNQLFTIALMSISDDLTLWQDRVTLDVSKDQRDRNESY